MKELIDKSAVVAEIENFTYLTTKTLWLKLTEMIQLGLILYQ